MLLHDKPVMRVLQLSLSQAGLAAALLSCCLRLAIATDTASQDEDEEWLTMLEDSPMESADEPSMTSVDVNLEVSTMDLFNRFDDLVAMEGFQEHGNGATPIPVTLLQPSPQDSTFAVEPTLWQQASWSELMKAMSTDAAGHGGNLHHLSEGQEIGTSQQQSRDTKSLAELLTIDVFRAPTAMGEDLDPRASFESSAVPVMPASDHTAAATDDLAPQGLDPYRPYRANDDACPGDRLRLGTSCIVAANSWPRHRYKVHCSGPAWLGYATKNGAVHREFECPEERWCQPHGRRPSALGGYDLQTPCHLREVDCVLADEIDWDYHRQKRAATRARCRAKKLADSEQWATDRTLPRVPSPTAVQQEQRDVAEVTPVQTGLDREVPVAADEQHYRPFTAKDDACPDGRVRLATTCVTGPGAWPTTKFRVLCSVPVVPKTVAEREVARRGSRRTRLTLSFDCPPGRVCRPYVPESAVVDGQARLDRMRGRRIACVPVEEIDWGFYRERSRNMKRKHRVEMTARAEAGRPPAIDWTAVQRRPAEMGAANAAVAVAIAGPRPVVRGTPAAQRRGPPGHPAPLTTDFDEVYAGADFRDDACWPGP